MRIVVYYLSAEDKGGLFVLKNFYQDAISCGRSDIDWVFLISIDGLDETDHVKVIRLPKGNALQRLVFENTKLSSVVNSLNPDLIISLQNMPIRGCKQPQFVYLHQSLQYCPKSFSFLKPAERAMAFRQHLICEMYHRALPKAHHIFVQTEWIKEATAKWIRRDERDITVVPVSIDSASVPVKEYIGQKSRAFFYPARPEIYKNIDVIIDACRKLSAWGVDDYHVKLTFSPTDNAYAKEIENRIGDLPIELIGTVPYEQIWDYYSSSILLFPSYLETCGVPLIEARTAGTRIIASDLPFAHEALNGYPNVKYFPYNDSEKLAEIMKEALENPEYQETRERNSLAEKSLAAEMLRVYESSVLNKHTVTL